MPPNDITVKDSDIMYNVLSGGRLSAANEEPHNNASKIKKARLFPKTPVRHSM